jgi:multidrug resistance protein
MRKDTMTEKEEEEEEQNKDASPLPSEKNLEDPRDNHDGIDPTGEKEHAAHELSSPSSSHSGHTSPPPADLEAQNPTTMTTTPTTASNQKPYTAFTTSEKWFIVIMTTMAAFFSPLSGQIYYPVMPVLVQSYHLTTSLVNISITTYMIFQGLAPSFMGTLSDASGRRPAYILAFAIYTAANIGLALQNSYAALLVLRCLQSAGSSGTVAFGYGVIADVTTTGERGKFLGPMSAGIMVAPALGPVIGGLLAQFLGWRSVFWFLVIISGSYLVLYAIVVPETSRKIVGDGSVAPQEAWRMSLLQYWAMRRRRTKMSPEEKQAQDQERQALRQERQSRKFRFPNPLLSFAILFEKDGLLIISYVGLLMFANLVLMTSTPNIFPEIYGFNELQVGLCFMYASFTICLSLSLLISSS